MSKKRSPIIVAAVAALLLSLGVVGCSDTELGGGIGAGGGALVGAAVGHPIIGAALGGAGGAVVGHEIGKSTDK